MTPAEMRGRKEAAAGVEFGRGWVRGVACGVLIGVALMLAVGRMT
jgi:hypothetical protein